MEKVRVLFLCVHNSARSQMAEAFFKKYAQSEFDALSAGIEPGKLNQNVVKVMMEIGIDISQNKTKSVFDLHENKETFSHVVTVCSPEAAEQCPIFPGVLKNYHWPFDDPSQFTGDDAINKTREVRDAIEIKVKEFIEEINN